MITCPSCAHGNVDGTQFCEMCGEELPQSNGASAAAATDTVDCPSCGHENPADNLACEACGADLKPASPSISQPPLVTAPTPAPASDPFSVGANASATEPDPAFIAAAAQPPIVAPSVAAPPTFDLDKAPVAPSVADANAMPAPATATPSSTVPDSSALAPAGNLAPGTVKLVVEQGQSVGAQFVLGDAEMLVGREDEDEEIYPDIDLSDQDAGYVHRKHAQLNFENGNLSVTHLGGANKTRVNNKPVPDNVPTPLKLGDKIGFGKVVVRLLPV